MDSVDARACWIDPTGHVASVRSPTDCVLMLLQYAAQPPASPLTNGAPDQAALNQAGQEGGALQRLAQALQQNLQRHLSRVRCRQPMLSNQALCTPDSRLPPWHQRTMSSARMPPRRRRYRLHSQRTPSTCTASWQSGAGVLSCRLSCAHHHGCAMQAGEAVQAVEWASQQAASHPPDGGTAARRCVHCKG